MNLDDDDDLNEILAEITIQETEQPKEASGFTRIDHKIEYYPVRRTLNEVSVEEIPYIFQQISDIVGDSEKFKDTNVRIVGVYNNFENGRHYLKALESDLKIRLDFECVKELPAVGNFIEVFASVKGKNNVKLRVQFYTDLGEEEEEVQKYLRLSRTLLKLPTNS